MKFLKEQLKKDQDQYEKFYKDYGIFIKEGIISNYNQTEKVSIITNILKHSFRLQSKTSLLADPFLSEVISSEMDSVSLSSLGSSSSLFSSFVSVIVVLCERMSSPCKSLFFKLPIQNADEQLFAASAALTLKWNNETFYNNLTNLWESLVIKYVVRFSLFNPVVKKQSGTF